MNPEALLILAICSQIMTFAGVLAGLVFNYLRDARNRRWLIEDNVTSALHTTHTVGGLRDVVEWRLRELLQEVVETKKAAGDAYTEANHVNLKLAALGLAQLKPGSQAPDDR